MTSVSASVVMWPLLFVYLTLSPQLCLLLPSGSAIKTPPAKQEMQETWIRSLDRENPLEKEMANYSSILAGKNPWMEEPDGLQPMGSQRVRQN